MRPKDGRSGVELCREIRATPALAAVPILCVATTDDVEERIGYLEAGRRRRHRPAVRPPRGRGPGRRPAVALPAVEGPRPGRLDRRPDPGPCPPDVAVYSPKGGVGTTTIATNIAVVAGRLRPDKVVLVDLDLQFGGVATHLNLAAKQTFADVVRDETALREPELLRTYAIRHDSGLHVLAARRRPNRPS